jgi:hypothetical protein
LIEESNFPFDFVLTFSAKELNFKSFLLPSSTPFGEVACIPKTKAFYDIIKCIMNITYELMDFQLTVLVVIVRLKYRSELREEIIIFIFTNQGKPKAPIFYKTFNR